MKIALDALAMREYRTGIADYIKNLIKYLLEIDHENRYTLFVSASSRFHLKEFENVSDFSSAPKNRLLRTLWEQTVMPIRLKKNKVDILHSPTFVCPIIKTCKTIITIHDMTFFSLPQHHTFDKVIYYQKLLPVSISRADRIIADSESCKRDIIDILKVKGEKIEVISLGVDEVFRKIDRIHVLDALNKYGLNSKYILFVGALEPRKNIDKLIKAYDLLNKDVKNEYALVIVGGKGWLYSNIFSAAAEVRSPGRVIFTGHIPNDDLVDIYNGAEIFVFPSLYEGFGIPVLEAMSCAVPVITSDVSSLPEISGGAAHLIDPNSVFEIKTAIEDLIFNYNYRQVLIKKGLENAKKYSYRKMAQNTLDLYKDVYGQ